MARYTVTIEADDDSAARTTIHLDTSSGAPRVLEYTVSAGSAGAIGALAATQIRLDAIVAAFGPAPAGAAPAADRPAVKPAVKAAGKPAVKKVVRPKPAAVPENGRVYRRMPDPDELIAAYRAAESVVQLARQYEVPRHTMNGWLSRLRRQGLIEPS
jgi:hypothetical protein